MDDRYLFKAKHFNEWHIGNIVKEPDGLYIRDTKKNVMAYINDESTICQCTGLKDRHGNLIFENDLMDGFSYPYLSGLDSEHDYFAEVCWCDDITGFGICTHKYKNSDVRGSADGEVNLIEDFDSSKWEVIGNIFDNPELLEGGE